MVHAEFRKLQTMGKGLEKLKMGGFPSLNISFLIYKSRFDAILQTFQLVHVMTL